MPLTGPPLSALPASQVIVIGGDTNLYRSAADTLKTDDALSVAGAGLGVTGTATISGVVTLNQNAAGASLQISNPNASGAGMTVLIGAATNVAYTAAVTGDTQYRLTIDAAGKHIWGTGALTGDTNLYRSAAATLKTDGTLTVVGGTGGTFTVGDGVTNTDVGFNMRVPTAGTIYMNWVCNGVQLWNDYMPTGSSTRYIRDVANAKMHVTYTQGAGAGGGASNFNTNVDVAGALTVSGAATVTGATTVSGGQLNLGSGANSDLTVTRSVATAGGINDYWQRNGTNTWLDYMPTGSPTRYIRDLVNAKMHVTLVPGAGAGGGASNFNTNVDVAGAFSVTGTSVLTGNIGFYGHAATAKQTVTGSRGGNAALASLLTALAATGLLTDSTTA